MKKHDKAEEAVRARLQIKPTPVLYCYLGDLTQELEHYQIAWEHSGGTCARAKLSLAAAKMKDEAWAEARAHLQEALKVKVRASV